jgi:outer membrane protein assembly factor BamB
VSEVARLKRLLSLFIIAGLIAVVVAASLAVKYGLLTPQGSSILWQRDIGQFATGLAAADGKVFTIDIWGTVSCYDAQNGESVWNGSIGAYWGAGLVVSGGRVYGGKSGAEVGSLDETTGEFQWIVRAPVSSDLWDKRAPASITVVDGRLFATADGVGVHNATTGELLWEYTNYGNISDQQVWWVSAYPLEDNLVYAQSGGPSGVHTYRLDPNNGSILWRLNGTFFSGRPIAYKGQVIMETYTLIEQNYSQKMQVVSLNETTGASLWSYNVGAEIYQPTAAYNGLLLFGASDGNFYALHMDNGKLAWKTPVDSENILAIVNSDNVLSVFPIQVDPQNQRVFWSFAVTEQLGTTSENKHDRYTGFLTSLDLATASRIWTKKIEDSGVFYSTPVGLVFSKDTVFLTENYGLWIFSASTGNVFSTQHFDHYVLPPVVSDNKVFVAADLYLIAYG